MQWRNVIVVAAFLLALVPAVAGCGGSGDAAEATAEGTLTKAQYVKRASHICKVGIDELYDEYAKWEKSHTVDGQRPVEAARDTALSSAALEARIKQLKRLKELGLPGESEATVQRIYEAWEEGIENGEERLASMQESNYKYAFKKAYVLSVDFGLADCWLS